MREAAGLDGDVNPYSIRHTVARWMRQNGVPAWEVAAQLGHKSRDYRTTELYAAFDPSYLSNAVRAIDRLFDGFAPVSRQWTSPSSRVTATNALMLIGNLERAKGFEPSTPTLARLCSTPELRPPASAGGGGFGRIRWRRMIASGNGFARVASQPASATLGAARGGAAPPGLAGAGDGRHRDAMPFAPLTPEQLFRHLDALGIAHRTVSHPPVFTVAQAAALRGELPGGHCKSLFLKDKKGEFWLVVMLEERRISLNRLAARLAAPRFSFAAAEDLYALLGVRPGSVTPFALVNDAAHRVTPVLDRAMLECDPLNYHPLENDRTTAIAPADLLRFIAAGGHAPVIVELCGLEQ